MNSEHKKYILENIHTKSIKEISQELNLKERKVRKFLEKEKGMQIDSKKETKPAIKKGSILISIALIIILGFAVYANSLNGEFIWDDETLVKNNIYLRDGSNTTKIFTENIRAGAGRKSNIYRPLQILTYKLDYSVWKLNVRGYHLTNIILHILVALSIYWFINLLYKENPLSLLTGILFVLHPIHTEAVSYISGRADVLAGLFMLLCLIFYIKNVSTKNIGLCILMLLGYICALLSKEYSLILPALIILYHYIFKKRLSLKNFLPVLLVTFLYILLRVTMLRDLLFHASYTGSLTLVQRIPGFFAAIVKYIKLLILPLPLHMEYGYGRFNFASPFTILGIIILFLSLFYALGKRKKNTLILFSVFWFFLTLLPQSHIFPINAYMAEHWLYMPSIGFFLIGARVLGWLYKKRQIRIVTIFSLIILLVFYSYLTIKQNEYWREPIGFYKKTIEYAPKSPRLYSNLARIYDENGESDKAIPLFKKAIELNPTSAELYINLGSAYRNIGNNDKAIALYEKSIELNPAHAEAYSNLGVVYSSKGDKEKAIEMYVKALKINPKHVIVHNNLGKVYADIGKNEEAIEAYKKAIEFNPYYTKGYNDLGLVYYNVGAKGKAIASFKKAIKLNPSYGLAYRNLAILYFYEKDYDLAIEYCDKAIELGVKVQPQLLDLLKPFRINSIPAPK